MSAKRSSGYRSHRLQQRRSERHAAWQGVVLYVLAGVVAFAAVLGAVALSQHFIHHTATPLPERSIVLLTIGVGERGTRPVAAVFVDDRSDASQKLYVIPRDYLFTGSQGEYVMGEDAVASGQLRADVERLIGVPVDAQLDLSYADLRTLTGGDDVFVTTGRPLVVDVGGEAKTFPPTFSLAPADVTAVLSGNAQNGPDSALLQQAVLDGVLKTAALQPDDVRASAVKGVAQRVKGGAGEVATRALDDLSNGRVSVARLPSRAQTSQGQFAFRPDAEGIMAEITRFSPDYQPQYTVQVENGTGEAGVAQAVAERLAVLDVGLPPVSNANTFDYRETQILASADALGVAQNIRAILGRGVVLGGDNIPKGSVIVIVGKDLKTKDLQ